MTTEAKSTNVMNLMVLCSDARLAGCVVQLLQDVNGATVIHREDFSIDAPFGVQDSSPDVVVVDVRDKGAGGLGIVYDLRHKLPTSRIIAVGTRDSRGIRRSLAECGADTFISTERIHHDLVRAICSLTQQEE